MTTFTISVEIWASEQHKYRENVRVISHPGKMPGDVFHERYITVDNVSTSVRAENGVDSVQRCRLQL